MRIGENISLAVAWKKTLHRTWSHIFLVQRAEQGRSSNLSGPTRVGKSPIEIKIWTKLSVKGSDQFFSGLAGYQTVPMKQSTQNSWNEGRSIVMVMAAFYGKLHLVLIFQAINVVLYPIY